MTHKSKFKKGFTIIEVLITSLISTMVLMAALSMFVMGSANWARGESAIDVESNSRQGVRRICNELREALYVSIDSDGQGLTYRKPVKDTNGDFVLPITWDGYDRRIYYSSGKILMSDGVSTAWQMARNVILKDPFLTSGSVDRTRIMALEDSRYDDSNNSADSYKIFIAGAGSVSRSVTVKLVTRNPGGLRAVVHGRNRETIYLRNIPQVAK